MLEVPTKWIRNVLSEETSAHTVEKKASKVREDEPERKQDGYIMKESPHNKRRPTKQQLRTKMKETKCIW